VGDDTPEKQHEEVHPAGGTGRGRNDGKDHHNGIRGSGGDLAISQESEQHAESGDVNQSFNVSLGTITSSQCVGIQGVANTGNA